MSEQWLYQANGRDVGPVSFEELQQLVSKGTVTADSEVRELSSFSWQRASFVDGLFTKPGSNPEISTKGIDDWYYRVGGLELGPLPFVELLELAKSEQLSADDDVKLGPTGKWRRVGTIGRIVSVLPFRQAESRKITPTKNPVAQSIQPWQEPVDRTVADSKSSLESAAESSVTNPKPSKPKSKPRRETPAAPIPVQSETRANPARAQASTLSKPTPQPVEDNSDDEIVLQIEECLERISSSGGPRIGYEFREGVLTFRGNVTTEGERLLVLRRFGAIQGVIHIVDTLTVIQAERTIAPAAPALAYRPVPTKVARPRSSGPGMIERLKEAVSGEYRNHAIGLAAATLVLAFWFYPRGPVRPVAVHPVKGKVIIDGEPLANAAVVLHRVGKVKSKLPPNLQPRGKAATDGTFMLETFDRADGAPDGEFVATVYLTEEKVEQDGERSFGPNLLPVVYSKPETSPFRVTIKSDTKELEPLKLTRQ